MSGRVGVLDGGVAVGKKVVYSSWSSLVGKFGRSG